MTGKIAIVGAGPSGCYLAQALLKSSPELEVDLLDTLPVPYGLVRYGVAADHQGTKAVARQFARVFERQGAQFFGNVTLGKDVLLEDLRKSYDAVVLAAGLAGDRKLNVPGDDLSGVYGAGTLTRALYEHPDSEPLPELGQHPIIVGNGNVAIDLLRLLAKTPAELDGTDLGTGPTNWLTSSEIKSITIVGRSPAGQAKFDPVMIKELHKLGNVTIEILGSEGDEDPQSQKNLDALQTIAELKSGPTKITFRFGLTPVALDGDGQVSSMRFVGSDGEEDIQCTSVLTAIGFESTGPLPRNALLEAADDASAGRLDDGLYATGWFRRGPRGTIPENRKDAQELAKLILSDLTPNEAKIGRKALESIEKTVSFEGWQRIDAQETADAPEGRCRAKMSNREQMLQLALIKETDA